MNMKLDTKRLKEIAEKATRGNWSVDGFDIITDLKAAVRGNKKCVVLNPEFMREEDQGFIAAFNPQVCLELLAEIDKLRSISSVQLDILEQNKTLTEKLKLAEDALEEYSAEWHHGFTARETLEKIREEK